MQYYFLDDIALAQELLDGLKTDLNAVTITLEE